MKKILAIAVATAISAPAMADLTVGGNAEYILAGGDVTTASTLETNLQITGTTEANGVSVTAFTELETQNNTDDLDTDDQYIAISTQGVTVTLAPAGGFATKDAFGTGPDTAAQASRAYSGNTAERLADVAVDFSVGGVDVQVSGNIADSDEMSAYATTTVAEGVTVAASYEDYVTGTGYAFSASAVVSDVTLGVNYASNDADQSATVLTAAYGDFAIASMSSEGTDDVYGTYTTSVGGAALTLGAGSSDGSTKVAAKLAYTF